MTELEAIDLAVRAIAIYEARHPRPNHVTITQAAEILGRSRATVRRMLLDHRIKLNPTGAIPIEAIDRLLASRP